ncbi:hypothetical protein HOY82DRAFT_595926 [Tuber indicum]|nr:hypothetical protein HOY82DRAFT_595926 [Tuber indicum]
MCCNGHSTLLTARHYHEKLPMQHSHLSPRRASPPSCMGPTLGPSALRTPPSRLLLVLPLAIHENGPEKAWPAQRGEQSATRGPTFMWDIAPTKTKATGDEHEGPVGEAITHEKAPD